MTAVLATYEGRPVRQVVLTTEEATRWKAGCPCKWAARLKLLGLPAAQRHKRKDEHGNTIYWIYLDET